MAEHFTEEEQLEALKRWWAENGRSLIVGVVIAVVAYFGWQGWQGQQQQSREAASLLYEDLLSAVVVDPGQELTEDELLKVESIAEQLKADHAGTVYAVNGALFAAKVAVEQDDLERAEAELRWAADNADASLAPLARLRLASVLYARENYADALAQLDAINAEGFAAQVAALRGDVLLEQDKPGEARLAYQTALDTLLPQQNNMRNIVEMKLNDLGAGADAESESESAAEAGS